MTGKILVSGKLDREQQSSYNVSVDITDGFNNNQTTVLINILDVNDNDPIFVKDEYKFHIEENNQRNISIGRVHATDKDDGQNGLISYYLNNTGML